MLMVRSTMCVLSRTLVFCVFSKFTTVNPYSRNFIRHNTSVLINNNMNYNKAENVQAAECRPAIPKDLSFLVEF